MKKNKLDLKDKIKDHKNFDKIKKKEIKRKKTKLKLLLFQLKKNKKLDMRGKIENHKFFYKRAKEKKKN
jgi:hypothetical protein